MIGALLRRWRWCSALLCLSALSFGMDADASPPGSLPKLETVAEQAFADTTQLRQALMTELRRGVAELKLPDMPSPYFAAATVVDEVGMTADAILGALRQCHPFRNRSLSIEVRVGGYGFDDSNFLGGEPPGAPVRIGWNADTTSLRRAVWLAMDAEYKRAAASYEAKRAARAARATVSAMPASFARVAPVRSVDSTVPNLTSQARLEDLARTLSGVFRDAELIQESGAVVSTIQSRRTLVTTEGTEIVDTRALTVVVAWGAVQAPDGMWLRHHVMYQAESPEALPPLSTMTQGIREVIGKLAALRTAPLVDNYTGPVLFEGRAGAQLVEHLFASQLSGTPAPEVPPNLASPSPTLQARLGLRVLPSGFSVTDDATLTEYGGQPLLGHYRFDDEGVPAERLEIVRRGRLTTLPMSRTPSQDVTASNGHGRFGYAAVAAGSASNLFVSASSGVSRAQLRRGLLEAARKEELPAAIIIRELEEPFVALLGGGQGRVASIPRPGTVPRALMAYRIHTNGREELVRGATFDSLDLKVLRDLSAASRDRALSHSVAHALRAATESGALAASGMSIVSPDLLLREVDVLRERSPQPRLPLLESPRNQALVTEQSPSSR